MKTLDEALATFKTTRRTKKRMADQRAEVQKFACIAEEIGVSEEVPKFLNAIADMHKFEMFCEPEATSKKPCKYHQGVRNFVISVFANGVHIGVLMEKHDDPAVVRFALDALKGLVNECEQRSQCIEINLDVYRKVIRRMETGK